MDEPEEMEEWRKWSLFRLQKSCFSSSSRVLHFWRNIQLLIVFGESNMLSKKKVQVERSGRPEEDGDGDENVDQEKEERMENKCP